MMKYMVFAFKPEEYISIGPATLTDAIKSFCELDQLVPSQWYHCYGGSLILQPPESFYAIGNNRQSAFYYPEVDLLDVAQLKDSFLSHIYDAKTRIVPKDSLYDLLAQDYCPIVHSIAISGGEF